MTTFKLEDCPKLGPYWLMKNCKGELAIAYEGDDDDIEMVGVWGQSPIGPWDGKAILGWTAKELSIQMEAKIAHRCFLVGGRGALQIEMQNALQSLIDNKPAVPVWCPHILLRSADSMISLETLKPIKAPKHWIFWNGNDGTQVPDSWDVCPVKGCHKPRPSE